MSRLRRPQGEVTRSPEVRRFSDRLRRSCRASSIWVTNLRLSLKARRRAHLLSRLARLEEKERRLVVKLHQNPLMQERIQEQVKELPRPRLHLSDLL